MEDGGKEERENGDWRRETGGGKWETKTEKPSQSES